MDPNATLAAMREAAATLAGRTADRPISVDVFAAATDTLTEGFQALDAWVTSGGFLPTDWAR